jgi:hypothetical protein
MYTPYVTKCGLNVFKTIPDEDLYNSQFGIDIEEDFSYFCNNKLCEDMCIYEKYGFHSFNEVDMFTNKNVIIKTLISNKTINKPTTFNIKKNKVELLIMDEISKIILKLESIKSNLNNAYTSNDTKLIPKPLLICDNCLMSLIDNKNDYMFDQYDIMLKLFLEINNIKLEIINIVDQFKSNEMKFITRLRNIALEIKNDETIIVCDANCTCEILCAKRKKNNLNIINNIESFTYKHFSNNDILQICDYAYIKNDQAHIMKFVALQLRKFLHYCDSRILLTVYVINNLYFKLWNIIINTLGITTDEMVYVKLLLKNNNNCIN